MSKRSIPNVDWANQLENAIRQFVKEKLELIMREEIKNFLEIEQAGTPNCFLQAKNAEKCKKKYIGLPAQDLRFQTGGRGRLDRGESVPQSIALSRKGQDVGVVNQAIH